MPVIEGITMCQSVVNPDNTFYSVKRFIGCKYDEIQGETDRISYAVKEDSGKIKIHCPALNKDFSLLGRDGLWDLNISRTGSRQSSVTNPISQSGYTTTSFSTTLLGENWDGVLYVDNILDKRAVIWEYQGFRPETKFTNRPREIGIRIKYKL